MKRNFDIDGMIGEINRQVGDGRVVCGLSGGVDSAVTAALIHKAIGERLHCIYVDHGFMRKNETAEIKRAFIDERGMNLTVVDAESRYLELLKGVTDPETKRKLIGGEFVRIFEEEARKLGGIDFLAQGTIYPDIVESGVDGKKLVKSHHNVGGLPAVMDFKGVVEPLKELYKEDVRELGRQIGLPDSIVNRQPFPGPGLAVRAIGELTKERLDVLRDADFIFREEMTKSGAANGLWQFFAILTGVNTVGVHGGERIYGHTVALRAVCSADAMTAEFARIPYDVLETVSRRITSEIRGVNRVVYDVTSKPPSTIEWE